MPVALPLRRVAGVVLLYFLAGRSSIWAGRINPDDPASSTISLNLPESS
jgi:hypothetical protein